MANRSIYFVTASTSKVFNHLRNYLPSLHLAGQMAKEENIRMGFGIFDAASPPTADVVVFSNCLMPRAIEIVEQLQRNSDIVFQIDDDFFNIESCNPAKDNIRDLDLHGLKHCLDFCNQIWTTTEHLRHQLGHPDKTLVVPNLVDMNEYGPYVPHDGPNVLWSGGTTHYADLATVGTLPALMPARTFLFVGMLPPQVCSHWVQPGRIEATAVPTGGNVGFIKPMAFERYQNLLPQIAATASVGICPVSNSMFNRSKSALKYCELAACGLPVVASAFDGSPYGCIVDGVNGFLATTESEWIEKIGLCSNEVGRAGYEWVRENLSWQSATGKVAWRHAIRAAVKLDKFEIVWGEAPKN